MPRAGHLTERRPCSESEIREGSHGTCPKTGPCTTARLDHRPYSNPLPTLANIVSAAKMALHIPKWVT